MASNVVLLLVASFLFRPSIDLNRIKWKLTEGRPKGSGIHIAGEGGAKIRLAVTFKLTRHNE